MPYPKKINDKQAMILYDAGYSDYVISIVFGVEQQSAYKWRKERGLPAVGKPGRPAISQAAMVESAEKLLNADREKEEQKRDRLPGETRLGRCERCIKRNGKCEYSGIQTPNRDTNCYWK